MNRRSLTPVLGLAAIPALLLSLAACSSSESGANSSRATPDTKTISSEEWRVAHAECLRDAGHDVADPDSKGGQGFALGEGDSVEKFAADNEKCTKEVTAKYGERPVSDEEKAVIEENRKTDDCLRKNGVDVVEGQARSADDVPDDVKKKCGIPDAVADN